MFRLKLLGGAVLFADDGPVTGRATQRRRIALLALLGAAGEGGASRDRLMALLWPESDPERVRHLLSDSVYRINQALGDAIVPVGDALALNPERVTSDVAEFSAAYQAAEWEKAVALYGGPLLDGFHISQALELERWIDAERDRFAATYARALEQLVGKREKAGDVLGVVEACRALATHDPLSGRIALRYMRALDAAGERAAAIRHARVHASLLTQELGAEPDGEVEAFASWLCSAPAPARDEVWRQAVPAAATGAASPPVSERRDADVPARLAFPPVEARDSAGDETMPRASTASGAAVEPAHSSAEDTAAAGTADSSFDRLTESVGDQRRSGRWRSLRRGHVAVAGAAAIVLLLLLVLWSTNRGGATSEGPTTIAVLPFADLSPGGGQEYLSDGITEELIVSLSRVPGLRVAARTSSFAFKNNPVDVREVGARLGVETVLEGSVRSSGDALRITAQLVSVRDGYPFWSETYERRMDDAFVIQDEIAQQIVRRLRPPEAANAVPRAGGADRVDPAAYELYLKGRYAWHQRTEAGLLAAARHLEEAVRLSPRYARAHAGLGEAYAVLAFYDYLPPAEAFRRGAAAARRALELDPGLASSHATLGYVALYHDWDFVQAERHFLQAIATDSGYSTAHQWYGNLLTAMGRFPEAEAAMHRAMELDPLSLIANAALGWVHYYAGEPTRAVEQLDRTLELDADFLLARMWKGQAYVELARNDSALAILEDVVRRSERTSLSLAILAHARAASGDDDGALALLGEIDSRAVSGYVPAFEIARVHVALGNRRRALDWLERAAKERSHSIAFLTVDPALVPLRGDPRFEALVRLQTR